MDTLRKQPNIQISHLYDSVPLSLPNESIQNSGVLDTLKLQLREPDLHKELLSGPYNYEADLVDRSPEAIRENALTLAVETLPKEVVDALEMEHDIRDNVAFHQPPTLQTIMLLAGAWDKLRESGLEKIDQVEGAFAASIDFVNDRDTRDIIGNAYKQSVTNGEAFHTNYIRQLSIGADMLDQNLLEAKEKLEIIDEANRQREEREKRLGVYTTDQLAHLEESDDAKAADMAALLED
jgi:hypothetical protein